MRFNIFRLLYINFAIRAGKALVFWKTCGVNFDLNTPIHTRGYYIQIGKMGGDIMWKSNYCYEVDSRGWMRHG